MALLPEQWKHEDLIIADALRFYARHEYTTDEQKRICKLIATDHEIEYWNSRETDSD
jgi:hypothetical protein